MKLIGLAFAIALFARQYGVSCEKCHTVVPHLTAFGAHFLAAGDRIPGVSSWSTSALPLAAKVNLVASSARQGAGPDGQGLPKAIVDEIELFSSGTIGTRAGYFVEQYAVDGAQPGLLRDAWIGERVNPWSARIPVYLQAGQFTLPLPVDPETFRESYQDYAPFVQQVGTNHFTFKAPKIGVQATFGDVLRGASLRLFTGPGYDRASGIAATGTDVMYALAQASGSFVATLYGVTGERPDGALRFDRFSRTGYALGYEHGKWESQTLLQTGFDSSIGRMGYASSGGFTQLRYAIGARFFALARYEGTHDTNGFARDAVALLGYRPFRSARVTLEDVIVHAPLTMHTMNVQYTEGF
ncbi:MAG: hypothetical protein KGN02_14770 [bacterium]|nr:hypothetical protein [bacterium]